MPSFTLLDDSAASQAQRASRLYTDLQQELCCTDPAGFDAMMARMQDGLDQGLFAVGLFPYELGVALQGLERSAGSQPARILLYRQCRQLDCDQVVAWLTAQLACDEPAGIAQLRSSVGEEQFASAIERIGHYIRDGDTYQVNYTFRYHFKTYGQLCALYLRLRPRQAVPYGALIALPDGSAVLSLSPELFVRNRQGILDARPMKGTAAAFGAGDSLENDRVNRQKSTQLSQDVKNRAENVMIVDLLRNDLSRIAKSGTVHVPRLFEVQRFGSVLQMTSAINAALRDDVTLPELFRAVYPCGSITGAPKYRTMQIIAELETEPRGIYTGAIGWFDPCGAGQPVPDFCLSVPIRTLQLQKPGPDGTRVGVMGVGAGIVYDSVAAEEYQECLLKARFLTGLPAQFSLFETMFATKEGGCRHLDRHLHRLAGSAEFFGLPCNVETLKMQLELACLQLPAGVPHRLRISIDGTGTIQIQSGVVAQLEVPVQLLIAATVQSSTNLWLQHKSSQRAQYDQAWQEAERHGAFDMLFCNEHGEITEGARSNVLVKIDGQWVTPSLQAGVLPGVMRAVLMADPVWMVTERSISLAELKNATEIAVCNALRGVLPATLIDV